jgi:hypothetical protein
LVLGALERRKMIAERAELGLEIIDGFIFEFMNMKKIMAAQLKVSLYGLYICYMTS